MTLRKRFSKIAFLFIRIIFDLRKEYKLIRKKGFAYAQKKMEKRHIKRANKLYHLALNLGGLMIKLCQYLSTRRDVMPMAYVSILSKLQDNVPPVPFAEVEKIIKEDFSHPEQVFQNIEEIPVASASLGQAHKAVLPDGRTVILKILKPGI